MPLLQWAVTIVTWPTRPRKWPGPLGTFGPRMKNRGKASASMGDSGRPESDGCRQLGIAGRVQGASQQGGGPNLGWLMGGGLSSVEGIGSGGGRSTSRSGGRWWGWSSRGGTPWRRGARVGVEGVRERSEESSAREVIAATGTQWWGLAPGAFSWR
jgi:hypothetical protein